MDTSLLTYRFLKEKKVIQLIEICRNDRCKYRNFSKHKKKEHIIQFIIRCNSTTTRIVVPDPVIPDLYSFFETSEEYEENQHRMSMERPEEQQIEDMIQDIRTKYPESIVHFERNEDPHNDIIYKATKMKYMNLYGSLGEHDEQILFHGTDQFNVDGILRNDFRLTSNPIHGTLYGRGIYFTNDIEKAISYSERGITTKYIIVSIVHIGDIVLGTQYMQNHPVMPNGRKIYDTSVDNVERPRQFVKKNHGTYNILGVIRIENYRERDDRPGAYLRRGRNFTGQGTVKNNTNNGITLWWVPPQYIHALPNVDIRRLKKIWDISPSQQKNYLCQIGHKFVVRTDATITLANGLSGIIKIFESRGRHEIVTITI